MSFSTSILYFVILSFLQLISYVARTFAAKVLQHECWAQNTGSPGPLEAPGPSGLRSSFPGLSGGCSRRPSVGTRFLGVSKTEVAVVGTDVSMGSGPWKRRKLNAGRALSVLRLRFPRAGPDVLRARRSERGRAAGRHGHPPAPSFTALFSPISSDSCRLMGTAPRVICLLTFLFFVRGEKSRLPFKGHEN